MDVGEVRALADGFAHALTSANGGALARYLAPDRVAEMVEVLAIIPRPVTKTQTVMVSEVPAEQPFDELTEEFVSIIEFGSRKGRVLLSSRWKANGPEAMIRFMQII
jgi:hypothetical protein